MAFDVAGARGAGYTDDEIADFLGGQLGFDTRAARKAGYGGAEIVGFLTERMKAKPLPAGVQPSQAGAGRGEVQPLEPGVSGQIERGNIDLGSRPRVRNADGSTSTIRSISVNLDGREVLIPTISDDGRSLSEAEAIDQYKRTGRHLGVFADPDSATAYARRTSDEQGKRLSGTSHRNTGQQEAALANPRSGDRRVTRSGAILPSPQEAPQPQFSVAQPAEGGSILDQPRTELDDAALKDWERFSKAPHVLQREQDLRLYQASRSSAPEVTAPRVSAVDRGTEAVRQATGSEPVARAFRSAADLYTSAGQIVPTTAKLASDILQLATLGGTEPISRALEQWNQGLESTKSSEYKAKSRELSAILNNENATPAHVLGFLLTNPDFSANALLPSLGSMTLGAAGGVAGGNLLRSMAARRGAGAAEIAAAGERGVEIGASLTNALMNAGATFDETDSGLGGKLGAAAIAAGGSYGAGRLTKGGAEGTVARGMRAPSSAQPSGRFQAIGSTAFREGAQEGIEGGSQAVGQQVGQGEPIDPNATLKQASLEGTLGAMTGAGVGVGVQVDKAGNQAQTAEQIARSNGFLATLNDENRRPTAVRQRALSTFQELGSYYGLPENAAKRAGEATASMPADEVPGFLARYAQALQRRGLFSRPLDEEALQAFNPPPEPDTQAQAPGVIETDLEQRLAESLGIAEPEAQPAQASPPEPTPVDLAAHEAATSPANDRPEPTEAQKDAGNYAKGHIKVGGLDISIENPQGSTRSGTSPDGTSWQNTMASHYGYVRGSTGKDGDHVDVFVKPGTPEDYRGPVYVVDQVNPDGGFDEHKALLGFGSIDEAREGYMANYTPNWQGLGAITEMPLEAFKSWVKDGTKRRPVGDIAKKEAQDVGTPVPAGMVAGGRRDGGSAVDAGGVADPGRAVAQPGGVRPDAGGTVAGPAEGGVVRDGRAADDAALTAKEPQPSDVQDPQNGASAPQAEAKASQAPAAARGDAARAAGPADAGAPAVQADGVSGARILARSGRTPNASTPIELRTNPDGTLTPFMEGHAMLDYDSGDPIVLPAGVSDLDAKKAIRAAGAVTNKTNFFPPVPARQQTTEVSAWPGRAPADVEADRLAEVLREQGYDAYVEERAKVAVKYGLNVNDTLSLGNLVESRVGTEAIERGMDQRAPRHRGMQAQARGEPATPPDTLNEAQKAEWLAGWDDGARSDAEQDPATQPKEAVTLEAEPTKPKGQAQKPASKAAPKIDDFGEKLIGARKDFAAVMRDAMTVDVAAEPLSKSWPEPDYQKLLDGGADPYVVAFIHAARDEVPTKPQSSWKLKGWVDGTKLLRGLANDLLNGTITAAQLRERMGDPKHAVLRDHLMGRMDLYQALGHGKSLKGITLGHRHFSLYRGEKNVSKWIVEQKAKATAFSNWPRELAAADTKEAAISQLKEKLANLDTGSKARGQTQFVIYGKRGQKGYFIGKKIGREHVDLKRMGSLDEARAYMQDHRADLEAALAKYQETPFERRPDNQPRVGDDHRMGAPVTPAAFSEAFGFRGVQFGNYVEGPRRQSDLNEAYDGLMDLAALIGVPSRALSLNGRLGLAFGARGRGGAGAPGAHYEPGHVVINLTKGGGPGALAHEWWHALDNYFGKQAGEGGFVTGGAKTDGLREQMRQAFQELQAALNVSGIKKRADRLDKRKTKPYWGTQVEISARAFEAYVIDRLRDQGASNDYLANVVSKEAWDAMEQRRAEAIGHPFSETYPYPTLDELPALRAAFDAFFQAVETRPTSDGNVEMFSLRDDLPVRLPDAIIGQPLSAATKHTDYQAAKAGDVQAAYRLARDLVTPEMVENVRQQVGEGEAVIVPVVAEEAAGRNKIPHAVAAVLGDRLGLAVTADIIQSSQPHRTGMDGLDRLFASPEFDGPVRKGARYILVDDTLTQGGTFAALGSHIEQGGGRVAAVVALTGKQYSAKLALTPETRARLYERFADVEPAFRAATGRGLDTLTESEARYLVTHRSPDAIRARFLAEGRADGSHRASAADLVRDLSARGNVQYEAANADDQRIASAAERAFARRRPGFVLRAVEAPGDRPDLRAARALARGVFGHRIIFVQQPAGRIFNGYAFGGPSGDFALIDVDTERPALAVVGHELLHRMRATRPDLYAELLDGLRGVLRGETAYTDALNARRAALGLEPIDQNLGTEELVADVVGDEFMQPEFWEALADAKPTGFQRIAKYVLDFIDSLLKTLRGSRPFGTDQYLSDIEAARAVVVRAMRQFSEGEVGPVADEKAIREALRDRQKVTETPEFKRWFGDSKVVDAEGKPLVVYHGTTAADRILADGFKKGWTHLTDSKVVADSYQQWERGDSSATLAVYVKAENPAYFDAKGQKYTDIGNKVFRATWDAEKAGHDALIIKNIRDNFDSSVPTEPHTTYVVFRPEQIKSAIGNRGTFDPNEADIRLSIANPPAPPAAPPTSPPAAAAAAPASAPAPTPIPEESAVRARQRELQDKFNRFTVLREWAKKQGISLTPESDVRAFEERMHGRMATRMEDFREKRVKPLVQKIQAAGFTMEQVAEFLHAQHAEERNLQIEKVSPGNTAGSGMTTADAKKVLAAADPKLAALANEFRSITADTKDILLKAGIVSQEMVDAWDKAYKHYVPLKGGPDDGTQAGTGGGLSVNGRQRRALGHAERDEHIVENILRDHERAIMLAEKNTVGHSLLAFVAELGNDAIATVGHPEKRKVLRDSTSFEVVGRNGAVVGTFDSQAAANRFIVTQDRSGLTIRKVTGDPQVTYMAAPMLAENEVQVYLKGHAVRIQLNDPVLARAYKNLGAEHLNRLMAVNRSVNAFLSKAYTGYNPEFLFVNVLRDLTTGLINITGKYGAGMAADALARYPKAMGSLLRYAFTGKSTPSIDAYRAAGGSTGAAYLGDIERIGADIKASYEEYQGVLALAGQGRGLAAARVAAKKLLNLLVGWIEKLNQAGENAMRLAVFDAVRNTQGQTVNDAASAAKNVTVNFNRKGEMGPVMGALYLFFNPAIQGTAAMMEALFKSQHKAQAWAMTAGLGAAAYTLAALQFGGDEDDDAWDNIPDHVKERSLIIRTGEKTYLTLPIPYGYGFFYALGNSLFDLQKGRDPDKVALNVASNLVGNFLPMNPIGGDELDARGAVELVPGMFGGELMRAGARVLVNRSGLGGEIVPDSKFDEGKPDSSRMWRTTKGSVYDRLAGGLNAATGGTKTQAGVIDVSPETLKFWVNTVTGGAGKFASDTIGLTWNVAIEGITPEVNEIPVARKFWRQEDIRDVRSRYWEAVREADEAAKDLSRARRGGDAEGVDQAAQKAALASFAKLAQKQNKLIKARRDMADSILADDSKSLVAKRAIVAEMEARERLHYERLLQAYDMTKEADKRRATERRERAQAEGR